MVLFDMVLNNGRVLDPETRMDRITNIGLIGGSIEEITSESIKGHDTIDATGLIIAPGSIDMHFSRSKLRELLYPAKRQSYNSIGT